VRGAICATLSKVLRCKKPLEIIRYSIRQLMQEDRTDRRARCSVGFGLKMTQSCPLLDSRVARITVAALRPGGRLGKRPGMGKKA
jgi:hypothetical protein